MFYELQYNFYWFHDFIFTIIITLGIPTKMSNLIICKYNSEWDIYNREIAFWGHF